MPPPNNAQCFSLCLMSIINYIPSRLDNLDIFREDEITRLENCIKANSLDDLLLHPKWRDESGIDFVYSSAKLEGNTYTRAETISLLNSGLTAGGKPLRDAQMILNLKMAYAFVLDQHELIIKNPVDGLKLLHKILMRDLLPDEQIGYIRSTKGIMINGTDYLPLNGVTYIAKELERLTENLLKIKEPFSQSLYAACNISYLQPFEDGNKRASRMLQNAILLSSGIPPLVIKPGAASDYIHAQISYYESSDYLCHRALMLSSFESAYPIANPAPKSKKIQVRSIDVDG